MHAQAGLRSCQRVEQLGFPDPLRALSEADMTTSEAAAPTPVT
jgi:hypothetical protein